MTDEAQIQVGVPISRIIERASDIFKTKETFSDATPRDVVDCFDRCLQSCTYPGKTHPMPAMEMLLRTFIHPAVLLRKWRLSQKALEWVHREIERKFLDSLANSGEMVGVVSAQSMGEPATQMTLNTFHMSGTSKANATRGVPRLKEIIHLSKNLKSPSLTIYLDDEHKRDQEKAEKVRNRTHRTLIRDLVAKTFIYFEPTADKVHPSDRQLIDTYRLFEEELATGPRSSSPWVLRFQLDPREMLERGISIEDIEFVLSKVLEGSAETIMGETLAQELVMRIRFNNTDFDTEKDAVDSLRELEKRILNTGVMGGVPGIDYAIMNKETNKHVEKNDQGDYDGAEEWVIITNGANFLGALQIDGIDPTKLISNDVVEIFNVLGIDAARNALI